ncbi:DUF5959 family protein [Streptomyces sp. WC2508]|uniref:DUF5959 family protein n=1 Tax=Streptomyces sp. WC2508 TaxID=3461405 RepID=UPI00404488CA
MPLLPTWTGSGNRLCGNSILNIPSKWSSGPLAGPLRNFAARPRRPAGPGWSSLTGERDCPEVVVEDESESMVTVRVPLVPPDDWIADHRQRLRQVMDHWVDRTTVP